MKKIISQPNQYVLAFERGEEVVEGLKQFCLAEKVTAGFLQGLGACAYLKLSSYDLAEKKYETQEFDHDLEIASLTGNIAMSDGELVIHMHGTFSAPDLRAIGGHVMAMKVAITCEIILTTFNQPMHRKLNPDIGLKLLD